MSQLGISNRTRVIAYDDRGGLLASRLWWILTPYGHSNVALHGWRLGAVDGGEAPDDDGHRRPRAARRSRPRSSPSGWPPSTT